MCHSESFPMVILTNLIRGGEARQFRTVKGKLVRDGHNVP